MSDFEKEMNNRYEGFDYDVVDEESRELVDDWDDEQGVKGRFKDTAPSPATQNDEDEILAALDRAEELEKQDQAHKTATDRIKGKLQGGSSAPKQKATFPPSFFISTEKQLSNAITSNSDLDACNNHRYAAQITIGIAPPGTSKTTVLSKLSLAVKNIKKTKTVQNLDKIADFKRLDLSKTIEETLKRVQSNEIEPAVRGLLQLASMQVTGNLLARCGQPGKKIRKLKSHLIPEISQAAEIVVESWKFSLTNST